MNTFIVVPAYNEEKHIFKVVTELKSQYPNIVVVDDCSADNTCELAQKAGAKVLRHVVNLGQGAALQTGNEYALENGADVVVHFDADGQFLVAEISNMLEPVIQDRVDICFGSRNLGKQTNMPFTKKYLINKPGRFVNNILTGAKMTDAHNGFRVMNRKAASLINIRQNRMAHPTEIMQQVVRHELRYEELPVTVIYHEYGQRFFDGFKILKDIFIERYLD